MPATVSHALSVTKSNDPAYDVQPQHWNSGHLVTFQVAATEISGLFSNANGISFGLSESSITASHNALTTAMASNRGSDFVQAAAAFAGTSASGTIASNGISVSIGPYLTTAMASNRGTDFVQAAAAFAGTSASGTIASNGISVSIGPYLTTAMASNAATLSNIKVSAGTLSANRSDITFSNASGVSFGLETNGVVTATVKTDYLTTAMASNRGSDFVQATAAFAGTSASGTIASGGISVSIGPYITTAALSGDTTKYVQAWELTGNTAGTTSSAQGTKIYFSGGANVTLSGNNNTIVVSGGAGGAETQTGISGISQSQTMYTSGTVIMSEQANITINSSVNGALQYLRFSVAAPGGAGAARSYFNWPEVVANSSAVQISGSTKYLQPIEIPHDLSVSYARFPITLSCVGSMASIATTANHTLRLQISSTIQLAFYSLGVGANSRSLQSYFTTSTLWAQTATIGAGAVGSNWSSGHTISFPGESGQNTSFTSSGAVTQSNRSLNTTQLTNFTNLRFLNIPMATSFSAGMYWMAYNSSTSMSTSGNANMSTVRILGSNFAVSQPAQSINLMGSATSSSNLFPVGGGDWSTNSIGTTTGSIALANLSRRASNPILYFDMIRQA